MPDEYNRLLLRSKLESIDRTIAAARRTIADGRLPSYQVSELVAWIIVNLRWYEDLRGKLAVESPGDDYAARHPSSRPPEPELFFRIDDIDTRIRHRRSRFNDGLRPEYKLELLPGHHRDLAERARLLATYRELYPQGPNLARLSQPDGETQFELDHSETFSG